MSEPISLNRTPQTYLDQGKWAELRAFAPNDLVALTYLNAPYPDPEQPSDFFCGREGSLDEAVRCYNVGRELVGQCRQMLIEKKLLATAAKSNGGRQLINSTAWINIWPKFATNRATGPDQSFYEVEIFESIALQTKDLQILLDLINWLSMQDPTVLSQKKGMLLHQASIEIGAKLTHSMFNAAYKAVFGRSRGRPRK